MDVDLSGFVLMGGATDLTRPVPLTEDGPRIRVRAAGMWGGVTIRTLKPGKRWDDKAELRKAWDEAGTDDDENDAEADVRRGPRHGGPHGHGGAEATAGPRHRRPSLPRGLGDIPPMPGPRSATRRGSGGRPGGRNGSGPPTPEDAPAAATPSRRRRGAGRASEAATAKEPSSPVATGNGVRPTGRP